MAIDSQSKDIGPTILIKIVEVICSVPLLCTVLDGRIYFSSSIATVLIGMHL